MKRRFLPIISIGQNVNLIFLSAIALFICSSLFVSSALAESGAPATYSLTTSSNGQGSITPSGAVTVLEGARASFIFNAETNSHVVDVIVDGKSVGPIAALSFENIKAPHTVPAIFEVDPGSMNASAGENGTIVAEGEAAADLL